MKTVIIALISAAVTSIVWIAGLVLISLYFFGPLPFQVRIDAPARVSVDDSFEIVINATNPTPKEMILDSIDIYSSLLEGFDVVSVSPPPSSESKILNFQSFSFSRSVRPNETVKVVVLLKAKKDGYFSGEIDICTPAQKFTTVSTGIVVEK